MFWTWFEFNSDYWDFILQCIIYSSWLASAGTKFREVYRLLKEESESDVGSETPTSCVSVQRIKHETWKTGWSEGWHHFIHQTEETTILSISGACVLYSRFTVGVSKEPVSQNLLMQPCKRLVVLNTGSAPDTGSQWLIHYNQQLHMLYSYLIIPRLVNVTELLRLNLFSKIFSVKPIWATFQPVRVSWAMKWRICWKRRERLDHQLIYPFQYRTHASKNIFVLILWSRVVCRITGITHIKVDIHTIWSQ